ncbi:hypothetical protein [Cellulomonas sp. S1-8]|uniref:hypothetical protein n=1 Tax=Cellulomonas sp. S1-8 TaxID=2904790 RepID=UPI0022443F19|nr:hypothetical protein [Cellulomonas sp. S1-8]UZN04115.1 hypothetical protein OKX07_04040 [Cellulomonas sp. S1-8]
MHLDVAMRTLRRNGGWAALIVLLALATGWAVLQIVPPTYTANVRVLYAVTGLTAVDQGVPAGALAAARAAQDAELVQSPVVLEPVIEELDLQDVTAQDLGTAVVGTATGTFLDVDVALGDPEVAARVAESLVAQLVLRAADDQLTPVAATPDAPLVTLDLAVVSPAVAPERPSAPDPLLTMAGALLVGLFLAVALLTWRARTDQVVDDEHDLAAATAAPVLAHLHVPARRSLMDAVTRPPGDAAGLRTALMARAGDRPHTSVAVVACVREPTLLVAAGLARAYAGTGRGTLLVEADLASPQLAAGLGLTGPGLADALAGSASVLEAAQPAGVPALRVVPAGVTAGDRADLVASRQAEKAWDDVRTSAEVVVVATGRADVGAAVLAASCDEVVLLVAPGRTRRDDVRAALHALDVAGAAPSGVVWVS